MEQHSNIHAEQEIIERLRKLPPQQLDEVIQFIDFVAERRKVMMDFPKVDNVKASILLLRGRGRGEQLVENLLRSRREDQIHDERK